MKLDKILISRTDSIGDVILTLPSCGLLKEHFPDTQIDFIGRNYTQSVIEKCKHITNFYDQQDLNSVNFPNADCIIHVFPNKSIAKLGFERKIHLRIGTSHRFFHWLTCNKLVNLGRKNSNLHEARLNLELLKPLGINSFPYTSDLWKYYGWEKSSEVPFDALSKSKFNLIFHIKSKGSAKEWASKNFQMLAEALDPDKFQIIISGTQEEGEIIKTQIPHIFQLENVVDTTGQFSLSQLIQFIGQSDGLLAASTGPLHIAAASGIHALGLYPFDRPMHSGRWAPIGEKAEFISEPSTNKSKELNIDISRVRERIEKWVN